MTRTVLRSIARFFRRLTRAPATLADRWDADSEMPSGVAVMEDRMNIPARALIDRAYESIDNLIVIARDCNVAAPMILGRAQDTHSMLKAFLATKKPGDTVAVEVPVALARAVRKWIASPDLERLGDIDPTAEWDKVDEAFADALAAYDGPDGDDGRAFTNAKGEPFYEP